MKEKKLACGRTEKDWAHYCSNPDYTWRTNKLILTKVQLSWHKSPHINIYYEIRCKKCGHLRQIGHHLDWSVIKQLLTGKVYF